MTEDFVMQPANASYDQQILEICQSHRWNYPQILKARCNKHLWDYILSCTQALQDKEAQTGHKYKVSTFVNWTLKHRIAFENCAGCGASFALHELSFDGEYQKYCSVACMNRSQEHIKAVGDTLESKYGARTPAQIPQFYKKMGDTCERLYGVRNYWSTDEVKAMNKSPEAVRRRLERLKAYNQQHYGVDWFVQSSKFKELTYATSGTSKEEKALVNWLKTFIAEDDIKIGSFDVISPKQLDIFIPSKSIAVEFNGMYWHSVEHGIDINYHLLKTQMCEAAGIQLIHVWEDEWMKSEESVKVFVKSVVDGTVKIEDFIQQRDDSLLEVDRSKFSRCAIPDRYEVIEETQPRIIAMAKGKDRCHVPDCGTLILRKKNYDKTMNIFSRKIQKFSRYSV